MTFDGFWLTFNIFCANLFPNNMSFWFVQFCLKMLYFRLKYDWRKMCNSRTFTPQLKQKEFALELQLPSKFAKGKAANVRWAKLQQSNGCSDDLTRLKPLLKNSHGQSASWCTSNHKRVLADCRLLNSALLSPPQQPEISIKSSLWIYSGVDCGSTTTMTCRWHLN